MADGSDIDTAMELFTQETDTTTETTELIVGEYRIVQAEDSDNKSNNNSDSMLECIEFESRENKNESEAVDTTVDLQVSQDENIASVKAEHDPRIVNPLDSQDIYYCHMSAIHSKLTVWWQTYHFGHLQTIL